MKMAQNKVDEEITQDKLSTGKFTIISDSQSALQAITRPSNKSGQAIIHHILDQAKKLKEHQVQLCLLLDWSSIEQVYHCSLSICRVSCSSRSLFINLGDS